MIKMYEQVLLESVQWTRNKESKNSTFYDNCDGWGISTTLWTFPESYHGPYVFLSLKSEYQ